MTVQLLVANGPKLAGLQDRLATDTETTGVKLMVAVRELVPRVAVIVADWLLATAPAVALNTAEVAPAATITDGGTIKAALLLVNSTALPPAGAAWFSVTVQLLEADGPRVAGLQTSAETCADPPPVLAPPVTVPPMPETAKAVP